jgi:hypothetical protein
MHFFGHSVSSIMAYYFWGGGGMKIREEEITEKWVETGG